MLRCAYSFHLYQVTMGSRVPQNGNPPGIRVSRYGNAFENWFSSIIQCSEILRCVYPFHLYQVMTGSRVPRYGNPLGFRFPMYGNPFAFPGTGTRSRSQIRELAPYFNKGNSEFSLHICFQGGEVAYTSFFTTQSMYVGRAN